MTRRPSALARALAKLEQCVPDGLLTEAEEMALRAHLARTRVRLEASERPTVEIDRRTLARLVAESTQRIEGAKR